ncbi:hypothetical protein TCAP_06152 [Tolypocladium capitatum]|uniref:Uncharacterized protein n=1 Tax=Tolypocladium capitatum TaxID=45235 RepID=A0A2K3Q8N1_9HYPO|nr:hypothetical protein TCAP_06152 [Tolypocladium capitatum]
MFLSQAGSRIPAVDRPDGSAGRGVGRRRVVWIGQAERVDRSLYVAARVFGSTAAATTDAEGPPGDEASKNEDERREGVCAALATDDVDGVWRTQERRASPQFSAQCHQDGCPRGWHSVELRRDYDTHQWLTPQPNGIRRPNGWRRVDATVTRQDAMDSAVMGARMGRNDWLPRPEDADGQEDGDAERTPARRGAALRLRDACASSQCLMAAYNTGRQATNNEAVLSPVLAWVGRTVSGMP